MAKKKFNEKLRKLTQALHNLVMLQRKGRRIKRFELRRIIMWILKIREHHTVNGWIDILLGKKLISISPSDYGKKPSRNTVYTINVKECEMLIYGNDTD